eukprot:symbB.v1.2.025538.t1/scaffold2483.1/size114807/12
MICGHWVSSEECKDPSTWELVDVTTVDALLGSEALDVLKVDVEGHEWQILQGAYQALSSGRIGLVIIEYGDKWSSDTSQAALQFLSTFHADRGDEDMAELPTLHSVMKFMQSLGYEGYFVGSQTPLPITGALWHDAFEVCLAPHRICYDGAGKVCWFDVAFVQTRHLLAAAVRRMVQFLEFCFEWLPQSRMLAKPPPRSLPAKPIPLKEQAKPKVFKYPKRPAVGKVRPPEPKVLPRAPHSLQLPVMPTLQLKATGQSLAKGRPQPPARPPGQLPKPPQEPPPPGHLLARSQSDIPELASTGFSEFSRMSPGTIGPFGLTLPELPPLPQGNLKAIANGKPAPSPPPKGSSGPRPPKTPPPVSKMFFVAPKGVPMAVPALPAPPSNQQPRACPPLPKLPPTRTVGQLSTIRSGGSPRPVPPPAPPPQSTPRGGRVPGLATSPAKSPPAATHEDLPPMGTASLPGAVSPEEVVEPRAEAEDVEREPARAAQLVRDPEHTMPAPDNQASSSSPNRRRRPVVEGRSRAEQMEMEELEIPNIPRAASSKSNMPLALPKGMQAYSQDASAPGRSPLASSPVSLSPGADNSPLRLAGSNLRMDVPKQASDVPLPHGKHAARFGAPMSPPSNPKAAQGPEVPGASGALVRRLPSQTMPRHPPKPPPKVRGKALLPTPPSGPPPAHAIVLPKGKPQDFASSSELQAVVAKAKPPPPLVHPPSEPLPSFVYRASSQALQTIMDNRDRAPK